MSSQPVPSGNELTSAAMVTCCPGVQISSSVDPLLELPSSQRW
jgi:hypothetical protein